ncbi:winged helix-turn-helix domain-containing protein [Enterobacter hormaechei]
MQKKYLINNYIEFQPSNSLLICHIEPLRSVSLPLPSARCFTLLLERGDLVTHNEFYPYVWGNDSDQIMPNNLYQNISLLRKALRSITPDGHAWVVTVPRKGFKLAPFVEVVIKRSDEQESCPTAPDVMQLMTTGKLNIISDYISQSLPHLLKFGSYLFLVSLAVVCFVVIEQYNNKEMEFADQFLFYKSYGLCELNINKKSRTSHFEEKLSPFVLQKCSSSPYVYITAYNASPLSSIIICEKPISYKKPNCDSFFVTEGSE